MNTLDFIKEGREYVKTPVLKAALNLLDKEDIESHIALAFKNGAEYALENQWISVKDKLPKLDKNGLSDDVFIYCSDRYIGVSHFSNKEFINPEGFDIIDNVEYWMPIPKLPK